MIDIDNFTVNLEQDQIQKKTDESKNDVWLTPWLFKPDKKVKIDKNGTYTVEISLNDGVVIGNDPYDNRNDSIHIDVQGSEGKLHYSLSFDKSNIYEGNLTILSKGNVNHVDDYDFLPHAFYFRSIQLTLTNTGNNFLTISNISVGLDTYKLWVFPSIIHPIPEPSTLLSAAGILGIIGIFGWQRRKAL